MNIAAAPPHPQSTCRRCGHCGPDLRLIGCNCLLHAKCTPLSLVIAEGAPYQYGGIPTAVKSNSLPCPICISGTVNGIQLFPMAFDNLERAVDLRKQCAQAAVKASRGKRTREEHDADDSLYHQIQAESSYLLLSHTRGSGSRDNQNHRTGRWSMEEVGYVDQLVASFDSGSLPLPHGVKLNEFLGDMLLCKSSRLTKKMKNAKLSTRSFALQNAITRLPEDFFMSLSSLQDKFLHSIPSEPMQLELKFNMTKLWRTHFSNLCLQVGYDLLDAREWLSSLEEMERRAGDADELIRKARRRRMGLALRQDIGQSANQGVFIGGVPARGAVIQPAPVQSSSDIVTTVPLVVRPPTGQPELNPFTRTDDDFLASLDMGQGGGRQRFLSEDFSIGIEDLVDPLALMNQDNAGPVNGLGDCGPFLEKIVHYIENENLPFEHIDVWVPSFLPNQSTISESKSDVSLRLFHAGHATRSDINTAVSFQLHEYGVYSANFSFAPGHGLPGRVYNSGKGSWECNVYNADPSHFERAGGAKVYGIRTAVGIPLDTAVVGRIIVALYSTKEIEKNELQLQQFATDFAKWTPEPKWKLVIELGEKGALDVGQKAKDVSQTVTSGANEFELSSAFKPVSNVSTMSSIRPPQVSSPYDHGELSNQSTMNGFVQDNMDSPASRSSQGINPPPMEDDLEQHIASMLGDHMPVTENNSMVQHFMSLRLLLLRSDGRRSQAEKELLDVIKKSYQGYAKDNKRSNTELASLLARDWMFLSGPVTPTGPAPVAPTATLQQQTQKHQCHVMPPTSVKTTSSSGCPTTMPSTLMSMSIPSGQHMRLLSQQHVVSYQSMGALNSGDSSKLIHRHHAASFDKQTKQGDEKTSREVSPTVVPEG